MSKSNLFLVPVFCFCLFFAFGCDDDDCPTCGQDNATTAGPDGLLYVPNQADQTMFVYDTKTLNRIDSFDIPILEPHFITFSHDYQHYYVVGRRNGDAQLVKYQASNDSLLSVIDAVPGTFPTAMAIGLNNDTAYLTDFTLAAGHTYRYNITGENFELYDTLTLPLLQAGYQTHDIRISSDGRYVVSAGYSSDDITIINTESGNLTPLTLDSAHQVFNAESNTYGAYGVLIDRTGSMAVLACRKGVDQLRLIDLKNLTLLDSIIIPVSNDPNPSSNGPTYMTILPDNNTLFVTTQYGNSVVVVRLSTREVLKTIDLETPKPFGISSSDDGSRVYVSCANTRPAKGRVYVIDGSTFEKLDSIQVGSEPFGLQWRPR
jgi:YVTN family beta-propeller protein